MDKTTYTFTHFFNVVETRGHEHYVHPGQGAGNPAVCQEQLQEVAESEVLDEDVISSLVPRPEGLFEQFLCRFVLLLSKIYVMHYNASIGREESRSCEIFFNIRVNHCNYRTICLSLFPKALHNIRL